MGLPKPVTISETTVELLIILTDSIMEEDGIKSLPNAEELGIVDLSELKLEEEEEIDELRSTEFEILEHMLEVLT